MKAIFFLLFAGVVFVVAGVTVFSEVAELFAPTRCLEVPAPPASDPCRPFLVLPTINSDSVVVHIKCPADAGPRPDTLEPGR